VRAARLGGDNSSYLAVVNSQLSMDATGEACDSLYIDSAFAVYDVGSNPYSIWPADLDADGCWDLAVANLWSYSVSAIVEQVCLQTCQQRRVRSGTHPTDLRTVGVGGGRGAFPS